MTGKNKHDIMDELLKGAAEDSSKETSSLAQLIHRAGAATSAKPQSEKTALPDQKKIPGVDNKKKSTHYLSEEIFADLDDARDKINALVHQRVKSRVSKSRIVDQALRMILKDFEEKGEKSPLIKEIIKNLRQK